MKECQGVAPLSVLNFLLRYYMLYLVSYVIASPLESLLSRSNTAFLENVTLLRKMEDS